MLCSRLGLVAEMQLQDGSQKLLHRKKIRSI
jgi:hypothetical protein